jgi:hypothetical protein
MLWLAVGVVIRRLQGHPVAGKSFHHFATTLLICYIVCCTFRCEKLARDYAFGKFILLATHGQVQHIS